MLPRVRWLLPFLLFCAPIARAALPATNEYLDQYCADCHDTETKKGGLDLTTLPWDLGERKNFDVWVKCFDLVAKGEMPPKKKARPEAKAQEAFLASIGNDLRAYQGQRQAETGRTVLRRLNRNEYERTMHDLLGITTSLARLLPEETPAHGFDTVAEGLRLSQLQIEKYLEAADVAIDAAIEFGPEPERSSKRFFFKDEKGVRANLDKPETAEADDKSGRKHRHLLRELPDGAVVYFNEGYPSADVRQFSAKAAGTYRIRVSGYGYQSKGQPIPMRVYHDNYREKQLLGWFEMPPDEARVVEFTATLPDRINLRIEPSETGVDEKGQNVYNIGAGEFTGAGLALQWVEVEGPLVEQWPPVSMKALFGDMPLTKIDESVKKKNKGDKRAYEIAPTDPRADAKAAIERFATRAFRRPLEPGEADRFVKLTTDELDAGRPFLDATRVGFRAVLTAPQFLLFEEKPGKLDDYALASRLSYFLWGTMPDDTLLAAAAAGKLGGTRSRASDALGASTDTQERVPPSSELRAQTERMLQSPKAAAFVQSFTAQWLDLRNIDATTPDARLYPEFDERLRVSMVQETEAFFTELLKNDLPVTNFIHSDFAMLNSRLAAHYMIDGVDGEAIRKVALPADSLRGGILTQASVLKVSANGTTTSPVLRGIWVMKRLLGQPPSPPPQNTGTIEPDTRGATTVREQLAKHRSMESCAGCHNVIDPPGFALEQFDVIGGFRERYRSQGNGQVTTVPNTRSKRKYVKLGPAVDATGELPDGRTFTGIRDFKKLLLESSDQVLDAFARNLVTYSTGAPVTFADRPAIESIVAKTKQQGGGVRTLIAEVVASPIFQTK
jgi:hypothetical protein